MSMGLPAARTELLGGIGQHTRSLAEIVAAYIYLFVISMVLPLDRSPIGFMQFEDGLLLFNHWNNVAQQDSIFYFYAGYVSYYIELAAYLASSFSFVTQSGICAVVALT